MLLCEIAFGHAPPSAVPFPMTDVRPPCSSATQDLEDRNAPKRGRELGRGKRLAPVGRTTNLGRAHKCAVGQFPIDANRLTDPSSWLLLNGRVRAGLSTLSQPSARPKS